MASADPSPAASVSAAAPVASSVGGGFGGGGLGIVRGGPTGGVHGRVRGVRDHADVQPAVPVALEGRSALPGGAHLRVAVGLRRAREPGHDLDGRQAPEDRGDQRLLDGGGAVFGAAVAPRLEEVGAGHGPGGPRRRLVGGDRQVDAGPRLAELGGEVEVRRGGVGGVAAEHHQGLDRAAVEGGREGGDPAVEAGLRARHPGDRVAHRAERDVREVGQGVDRRGLLLAHQDDRRAARRHEVLGDHVDPLGGRAVGLRRARRRGDARPAGDRGPELAHEGREEPTDVRRLHAQAVVGGGAGDGEAGLDHVQTRVRGLVLPLDALRGGPTPGVPDRTRAGAEEVGVEGEDRLRAGEVHDLAQPRARVVRTEADQGGARASVLVVARVVHVDLDARVLRAQLAEQADERRRRVVLHQDGRPGAREGREGLVEVGPGRVRARLLRRAQPVAVPHPHDLGLGARVDAAPRGGVVGVAVDLRRSAVLALDQQAGDVTRRVRGGRVLERAAGDEVLGARAVGEDVLPRLAHDRGDEGGVAAGERGRGRRRRRSAEEAAPREGGVVVRVRHRWHPEQCSGGSGIRVRCGSAAGS